MNLTNLATEDSVQHRATQITLSRFAVETKGVRRRKASQELNRAKTLLLLHIKYLYPTGSSPKLSWGGSYAHVTSPLGMAVSVSPFSCVLTPNPPKSFLSILVFPGQSWALDLRSWLLESRELFPFYMTLSSFLYIKGLCLSNGDTSWRRKGFCLL